MKNTAPSLPTWHPHESDASDAGPPADHFVDLSPHQLHRQDWLVALSTTVLASVTWFAIAITLPSLLLQTMDFWFEADTVREVSNMTSVSDDHYRTSVHPLVSLLTFTPVYLLRHAGGLSATQAVLTVTSGMGGLWLGTLYLFFRLMGCRRLDAGLFTAVGASSAAALFWLPLPNSYTWGSLSILAALILCLLAAHRPIPPVWYVAVSACTLSVTVTNWAAGLLTTLAHWPWRRALQLSINAFCLVVLLWGVQKFIFPTAEFFLGSRQEALYVHHAQSGTVVNVAQSFLFHSLVAPPPRLIDDDGYVQFANESFRLTERLTFQFSAPGSASPLGMVAVALWSVLLLIGGWHLVIADNHPTFRLVLAGLLAFQLTLHLLYGEETFTYSLHYMPLLLAVAAWGTFGAARPLVLCLAALLAVCAGVNNWEQLRAAQGRFTHFTAQREVMTGVMRRDPSRPWPRSMGHVTLATPGTPEMDRAYHEPGGDFSPRTPSFGVSFWFVDTDGHPALTSQTVPLGKIQQSFEPSGNPDVPDVVTRTPFYEARWRQVDAKHWELRLKNKTGYVPALVFRSVGPAGGPITALTWTGERLRINDRWVAEISPRPTSMVIGDEDAPDWVTRHSSLSSSWTGQSGWGYARALLRVEPGSHDREYRLILTDERLSVEFGARFRPTGPSTQVELPDLRFKASMQAQEAHLMMSLVADETRPGDPTTFYRAGHGPGASIVAALARARDPHVSRVLSRFLATQDFAGANGAEPHQLGIVLWALGEAALYIHDRAHDEWLWPHIQRKATRIHQILMTSQSVEETLVTPSPYGYRHGQQRNISRLVDPAYDGLLVERGEHNRPSLYANAVSYRGLCAAAEFAERLEKPHQSATWRKEAAHLRAQWERHFGRSLIDHPAYTVGMWSAGSTTSLAPPLPLHVPRESHRAPANAVMSALARAHQQLWRGHPDAVWTTVQDVWNLQSSPGLYTWEIQLPATTHVADGWQYVRGWRSATVSPDYEVAAQMLLLQQDMLARVDARGTDPRIIVGAGIPTVWVSHRMAVTQLPIPGGSLSWFWNGQRMRVTTTGLKWKVQLGAAFPPGTEIAIDHIGDNASTSSSAI